MRDRAENEIPKTNNHVEGWHRKMQAAVTAHHPNFWRFLDVIRKQQAITNLVLHQAEAGAEAAQQRRKYQATARRILTVVQDYHNRPILDFLRGIAYNVQMWLLLNFQS